MSGRYLLIWSHISVIYIFLLFYSYYNHKGTYRVIGYIVFMSVCHAVFLTTYYKTITGRKVKFFGLISNVYEENLIDFGAN